VASAVAYASVLGLVEKLTPDFVESLCLVPVDSHSANIPVAGTEEGGYSVAYVLPTHNFDTKELAGAHFVGAAMVYAGVLHILHVVAAVRFGPVEHCALAGLRFVVASQAHA
jgi:hypothetical protein